MPNHPDSQGDGPGPGSGPGLAWAQAQLGPGPGPRLKRYEKRTKVINHGYDYTHRKRI